MRCIGWQYCETSDARPRSQNRLSFTMPDRCISKERHQQQTIRIAKMVKAGGSYPSFVGSIPTSYGALFLLSKMPTATQHDSDSNYNYLVTMMASCERPVQQKASCQGSFDHGVTTLKFAVPLGTGPCLILLRSR